MPIADWQGFAGEGHNGMLGNTFHRQQAGYMSSQWNSDLRGFPEPLSFGYTPYMLSSGNMASSIDSGITRSGMVNSSATAPSAQTPHTMSTGHYFDATSARRHRNAVAVSSSMNGASEGSRYYDLANARASMENRRSALQAHMSRSYDYAHSYTSQDLPHPRRRMPPTSDSDDDDDSAPDLDQETSRSAAGRLYGDMDEERMLAAMRGQLATGKKVPSKETIASLEKLTIKGLNESDKSCIICYNDFGVPNPEGLIEQPIRLPKCKHIFGDNCIKKWFEDSDTCPYCRDKLPSERVLSKSSASREAYHRYRERTAGIIASQAALQQSRRQAAGGYAYTPRFPSSDELAQASHNRYARPQVQENHHYPMRQEQQSDIWTFSSPSNRAAQRDSPERRRQQVRGRTSLGRPTSVGSGRYTNPSSSYQHSFHRGGFQGANADTNGIDSLAHRPASPGFTRQNSDRSNDSTTNHHPPTHNRLSSGSLGRSSPEASPPVAIGSGVASADHSTSANPRVGSFPDHLWLDHDHLGGPSSQINSNTFFPSGRANDFARPISFDSRSRNLHLNENAQHSSAFVDPGPMPPGLGDPLHNQANSNRR